MRRNFHLHPVAGPQSYKIRLRRSRRVRENQLLILQLHLNGCVRKQFHHYRLYRSHGRVNTHGPFDVTATVCSK